MHMNNGSMTITNDQSRAEEMIKKYFSAMMDNEGYEVVQKKYLKALKEISLNRRGSLWFSLWMQGNVMIEGFSVPSEDTSIARMEAVVEIMTACSGIAFNCGQIAYINPAEDEDSKDLGYVWSLTPGVSCAEAWTISPNPEDPTTVQLESVTKEHFTSESVRASHDVKIANEFGGFITVYCASVFDKEKDGSTLVDADIKIFAQYLQEKGHDLTFNFDKILCR